MIHRFDLDGRDLGRLRSRRHRPRRRQACRRSRSIPPTGRTSRATGSTRENPDTWGFAPPARRVWGLAVYEGRLYYSVAAGPQIWSVGIAAGRQLRRRSALGARRSGASRVRCRFPISHSRNKGAMILAQRALIAGAYDYSAFTRPGEPQVLRFWLKGSERSAVARPLEAGAGGIRRRLCRQLSQHQRRRRARLRLRPGRNAQHRRPANSRCGPRGKISATSRRCAASSIRADRLWCTGCKAARRTWCATSTSRRRPATSSTTTTSSTTRAPAATSAACGFSRSLAPVRSPQPTRPAQARLTSAARPPRRRHRHRPLILRQDLAMTWPSRRRPARSNSIPRR